MRKLLLILFPVIVMAGCRSDEQQSLAIVMPKFDCSTVAVTSDDLTQIDTSGTPRANTDAEILSMQASGAFIAPEGLYQRVSAELTTISATYPAVAALHPSPCYDTSAAVVNLDDASYTAAEGGTYTAWDDLNLNLQVVNKEFSDSSKTVGLEFDARYNMLRVVEAYKTLSGVLSVSPAPFTGVSEFGDDACLAVRDTMHYYVFSDYYGDFSASNYVYTGFETDSSGNIRMLGTYDTGAGGEPPAWYNALEDCRVYLTVVIN